MPDDNQSPSTGPRVLVERREPDGTWSPVVEFTDMEAPRGVTVEYRVVPHG